MAATVMLSGLLLASVQQSSVLEAKGPKLAPLANCESRTPIQSLPGNSTSIHVITEPGSYYLRGSIEATSGDLHGITVDADHVTIDLNGFELVGSNSGTASGIFVVAARQDVRVFNGSLRNWNGLGLFASGATGLSAENLYLSGNQSGMNVGPASLVSACIARGNSNTGIAIGPYSRVHDCIALENGDEGFVLSGTGASIHGCTSAVNRDGIQLTGDAHRAERNVVNDNSEAGVLSFGATDGVIVGNSASGNADGFDAQGSTTVLGEEFFFDGGAVITTAVNAWANLNH